MEELVIDNVPEKITRYVISEMSVEIYPENKYDDPKRHLYQGVVLDEGESLHDLIRGVYKTEEEAKKAFKCYETRIECCGKKVRGLRVTEYYLYESTFGLKEVIKNRDEVNSEEDFDKHIKEDCLRFVAGKGSYNLDDVEWESKKRIDISPMNIVVHIGSIPEVDENLKWVLFHNYNDVVEFEHELMDNCDMHFDDFYCYGDYCWYTEKYFTRFGMKTISKEEFKDWFNDQNGLEVNKKREVKCRL